MRIEPRLAAGPCPPFPLPRRRPRRRAGRVPAAIGILAVSIAWAFAAAPATRPDSGRIAALIAQLGSPRFRSRLSAQEALVAIGAPAESALRDAAAHSVSPEIRARAKSAANQIEDNLPDSPTYVSLPARQASAADVWKMLAQQAGGPIDPSTDQAWNPRDPAARVPRIDLDIDHLPLLVALEKFSKSAHVCLSPTAGTSDFQGMYDGPLRRPVGLGIAAADSGVWDQEDRVAVIVDDVDSYRDIELGSNHTHGRDIVEIDALFDPRLAVVAYQPPRLMAAMDDKGNSLLAPPAADPPTDLPADQRASRWGFSYASVPLHIPPHHGKTIALLRGEIPLRVGAGFQTLGIPDLAKAVSGAGITAGPRKLEILQFSVEESRVRLQVRVTDLSPPKPMDKTLKRADDIRQWMEAGHPQSIPLFQDFDTAMLIDAHGMTLHAEGLRDGGGSETVVEWDGHFVWLDAKTLKGPIALRWRVVTKTREIAVPFTFRNLPLPPPG